MIFLKISKFLHKAWLIKKKISGSHDCKRNINICTFSCSCKQVQTTFFNHEFDFNLHSAYQNYIPKTGNYITQYFRKLKD